MYLDHTNPDSIAKARRHVESTLLGLRNNLLRQDSDDLLAVRLCANSDGEFWFATGEVQFDCVHSTASAATEIACDSDDDELRSSAESLVDEVASQLADLGGSVAMRWLVAAIRRRTLDPFRAERLELERQTISDPDWLPRPEPRSVHDDVAP